MVLSARPLALKNKSSNISVNLYGSQPKPGRHATISSFEKCQSVPVTLMGDRTVKSSFGVVAAAAFTALISAQAFGDEAPKAAEAAKPAAAAKGDMVKCVSNTCAGKFSYNGKENSCNAPSDAMEVPKKVCDAKKGLKILK